ncbi:fatty acyl-CoA reductase wat-like [Haematobia irritans]|uniref:fatty acyl-CoA reductase wat-like n=1 Tax=Haematobia irritans TaxID=7368 RepID=UPI003F4F55A7
MIPEYFENREIFITGGSGIVGKALIDKLLRSCNVRKIYILLRPKKSLTITQRLQKVKDEKIFRRLLREKPNEFDDKVIPIPGDVELPLLGISRDSAKLMENVSIVIHSAATVRFDERLRDAIRLNVGGTVEIMKFCETLKNLKVFMHVSTFYSNPYLDYVEPKMYDSPMDWKFCLGLCERSDISDEMLDILTKKLIVGFPNTYCFTKNLAESAVNDYRNKLPVAIFRPSIVVHAIEDPEPGFPPAMVGAMGVFVVASIGVLKAIPMAKTQLLDLSPQDFTIKSLLYYIVRTGHLYEQQQYETDDIPIYQLSLYGHNPIEFPEYINMADDFWKTIAAEKSFLIPGITVTENMFLYNTVVFFKQLLPAFLVDVILKVCGRKPAMMKIQRKIYSTVSVMQPFLSHTYKSSGISHYHDMIKQLFGTEFNLDALITLKSHYMHIGFTRDMIYKCREILLNEDPSTIPRSRLIMKVKIFLYRAFQIYLAYKVYWHWIHPIASEWNLEYDWHYNNINLSMSY